MRPHALRLQAFGPFPGEVEVDLDALSTSGLFLLHGETGAGKTTLLDGLGFALFGKVPGARGEARLRCDTAPPDVRTEVRLEVTLSGRRFLITRSPAQERPKKRGEGVAKEQSRMLLQELRGGQWETVSTRIDEASAELEPLLGMSSEQFFQVVLLPQGEFARFLRSRSAERGELLQRLFGTERFAAVEQWLARRRAATAGAVAAARAEVRELASRAAQAAAAELPDDVLPGWARGLRESAEQASAGAAAEVLSAEAARDAARAEAESARALASAQARRREAEQAAAALAARTAAVRATAEESAAAGRAAEVAPLLEAASTADAARARAQAAEARARAALTVAGLEADLPVEALRTAAEDARRRSGALEALRGTAEELAAEHAQEQAATARAQEAAGRREQLGARAAALPVERAAALAQRAGAEQAAEALPDARARVRTCRDALTDARALAGARDQRAALRETSLAAREALAEARDAEADLREARLVTMVAELADRLEPGAPCEVCGALEHPDPYEGQGEGVGREDEERARGVREAAEAEVSRVAAELSAVETTEAAALARLSAVGLPEDVAEVTALLAEAESAAAALEAAAAGTAAARGRVEDLDREAAEVGRALAEVEGAQAAAEEEARAAGARAVRLAERLDAVLEGAPDLGAALTSCADRAEAAEAARTAAQEALRAAEAAAQALVAAAAAAERAGFPDVAAARAAVRDDAWRAAAERELRAHADAEAATAALLADPELAVPLDPPADVAGRVAALTEADAALAAAQRRAAEAASRAEQLDALVPGLDRALQDLQPLEEEATRVRRLADLCAGGSGNTYRMTLSAFVLAARLEEVAAAASGRLLRMTQGRYSLVHTDGAARGGARSGLGLLARDSWTGQDRDTATLSGGETFLASLALALGLADVVQAEAGGTRIEALFVDEGFGTLDEDTLDEVMDVLDGLREGGRVVGLVSHVAELRQRIPAQVRVHKSRTGSTLSVTGC